MTFACENMAIAAISKHCRKKMGRAFVDFILTTTKNDGIIQLD